MTKIPVKQLVLERAEGTRAKQTCTTWEDAESTIARWATTAPDNGAYDKTDFYIVWENGQEYSGRFDLQYKHFYNENGLAKQVKSTLEYFVKNDSQLAEQAKISLDTLMIGEDKKPYLNPEITKRFNDLHMYKLDHNRQIELLLNDFKNKVHPYVQNQDQQKYFEERTAEFEKFVIQRYEKSLTILKTPSPLIAGRANYPARKMNKELHSKTNYDNETREKIKRFINNSIKALKELETQNEKEEKAFMRIRKECRILMAIKAGKMPGYDINLFKNSLVNALKRMFKEGYDKEKLYAIFKEEGMSKVFTKRHSIYKYFETEEEKPNYPYLRYLNCEIVADEEADRLKIIFFEDHRPDEKMKEQLKKKAFRWSPKNRVWQRKLTMNAYYEAKSICEN
ncbi:hypothetical protein P8822_00040 [Bacillus sonorensis]|uniref:hypothetical protein n=1 Tax=Bacillus sonorensis TaxID=119858 RepID=UPI002DBF8E10|nr:hypothetical protein [Bacillus sonorensis]MEC0526203.1 hypothetical protein [Bacillus sonorensis]